MQLRSEFKSAYAAIGGYSFLVSWQIGNETCSIETKSRSGALTMCADLKTKNTASCRMIDCLTGRTIKKLA